LWSALVILLATTIFWAVLGSRLQQHNADQLVNAYLFQNGSTLNGASFPGQHTFLLKWPLFYLIKLMGYSSASFMLVTVGCALATVAALAALIYRIERRPIVCGTIFLALASVLLMVPAQPYAGGLLPVSMAMLTTRNLEYVVFIGSLALLARQTSFKSRRFWLATGPLALTIASDKLFLTLTLLGALLALISYALTKRWKLVSLSTNWLVAGLAATVIAIGVLGLINASGLTHITTQAGVGPYGAVTSAKNLTLGVIYGIGGLFTNFGANPAFDAITVRQIPHQAVHRLFGIGGFSFVVNAIILIIGLAVCYRLLKMTLSARGKPKSNNATNLSVILIWTTLAMAVVFVGSNHYYAVDARYLGISLFTVFVAFASFSRTKQWLPEKIVIAGTVISLSILLGLFAAASNYHADQQALASVNERNAIVAQALTNHHVQVLVGDYWRVLPIKSIAGNQLPVLPLQSCTQPREALTSQAWQTNLHNHSFAYLLTFDGSLTDYPNCSLQQIISAYGRPNTSTLIAGTLSHPQETLLFYDRGIHHSSPKVNLSTTPSTVLPITLDALPYTTCSVPTIMNIVAHQDDDLLFMNPDLLHEINAGDCVRSVYITAGDAGSSRSYWLSREQGSEAAYGSMIGFKGIWVQRVVELSNHEFISVANPQGNSKVSLIFFRLPDGNLKGEGFISTHFESLAKLEASKISVMNAIDGQSNYTLSQLSAALTSLMHLYQPAEIHTQSNFVSKTFPDHSDHMAVGRLVQQSYRQYELQQYNNEVTIPLKFYTGYPIHGFPANVSGSDLITKEAAFLAYAKFDDDVCHTAAQCIQNPTYGAYLTREYQESY